jgi:galactose-1-phosphate uridylyltransferase
VNPFPIFSRHLTIPSDEHTDQRIRYNFGKMLSLADALPDYVIFYNGPQSGASAPDHFHFQAGNKGFMPVEKDFFSGKFAIHEFTRRGAEAWCWRDYLRGIISLKGTEREPLETLFHKFFERFSALQPDKPEPMMNILVYKSEKFWIVHIIPRKQHRPVQFFAKGRDQILVSPASVDLGGVVITPGEEDFMKIKAGDISDIFRQVCYRDEELHHIISDLK